MGKQIIEDFVPPSQQNCKHWSRTGLEGRSEKFSIISAFDGASGSGILSNGVTGSIE